jgi:NADH-quinone oxidoreductase subunit L
MEYGAHHVHDHHTDPQDMRFMGGLRQKMPATFMTFLIGGLALSGFPIITAGFWSKDEILAEAWYGWSNDANVLPLVVFVMLSLAAFLTAFYTMRQISMTFLGKPRSPLAEHAHESNRFMVVPLVLLSVFAIGAGWFGIPEKFPVLGPLVNNNFFHHFVGATIYEPMKALYTAGLVAHPIQTLPKSYVPLVVSVVVALGGLLVGWLVYARKPLTAGQQDPLVAPLGPLHVFLNRKWYWDELYQIVFIRPTVVISERVAYEIIDKGAIDGILHLIAHAFYRFGQAMKRTEELVFGDAVDWVKDQFLVMSKVSRQLQTGKIQEYVLVSLLIVVVLTAVILAVNFNGPVTEWFSQILFLN